MKIHASALIVGIGLLTARPAPARPVLYSDQEMSRRATIIALVRIPAETSPLEPTAAVIRRIRGNPPAALPLGERNSSECRYDFQPGTYLVFLDQSAGKYVGTNCSRSWLRVIRGRVPWRRIVGAKDQNQTERLDRVIRELQSEGVGGAPK